ncbi:hypothetical protein B296_00035070 [Ensete ventricosum]|uniref:Uncharacterized protein n=1 Tax=Ensete ventricosum TaxID=4639 RepID=A0A426XTL4_ENSVE|nr:hypothetical protein B296_00035070 [Ensete ventricosum]
MHKIDCVSCREMVDTWHDVVFHDIGRPVQGRTSVSSSGISSDIVCMRGPHVPRAARRSILPPLLSPESTHNTHTQFLPLATHFSGSNFASVYFIIRPRVLIADR